MSIIEYTSIAVTVVKRLIYCAIVRIMITY